MEEKNLRFNIDKYGKEFCDDLEKITSAFEGDDPLVGELLDKFLLFCNTAIYERIIEGYFFEFETIKEILEFFVDIKDHSKSQLLANIMCKHYTRFTIIYNQKCLEEEKFEFCNSIKSALDSDNELLILFQEYENKLKDK